jgi:amino acid transporter
MSSVQDSLPDKDGHKSWSWLLPRLLLGRPLANRELKERKLGPLEGVPAMGLDGLSSSAYGPEAALAILIPAGGSALAWLGWIMAPILALLAILYASYRQTVHAYPVNGGLIQCRRRTSGRQPASSPRLRS